MAEFHRRFDSNWPPAMLRDWREDADVRALALEIAETHSRAAEIAAPMFEAIIEAADNFARERPSIVAMLDTTRF